MTTIKVLSATALVFLLATATYARARQEHQEQEHQEQPKTQEHEQPAKPEHQQPEHQQPEAKPQPQPKPQQPQAKAQQEQKPAEQQHSQPQAKTQPNTQHTQQDTARQHSQPALRLSVRGSGRIPDDRFHSNFGREHEFRIGTPVMVGGYSRFQYGGYWFGFVQPWPVGWYYTDNVYVDYVDGGYYMYNPYYPGARFSISVVL